MSFAGSLLILLCSSLSVHFCHSLPPTHASEKTNSNPTNAMQASYLAPEMAKGHILKNTIDMTKSIQSINEQSKYLTGSKEDKNGCTEENNQGEVKYKSIKRWRKLIVVVSEMKAKSNIVSSQYGGHKRKRSRGIDIDYDPPKTHPPSHN